MIAQLKQENLSSVDSRSVHILSVLELNNEFSANVGI